MKTISELGIKCQLPETSTSYFRFREPINVREEDDGPKIAITITRVKFGPEKNDA